MDEPEAHRYFSADCFNEVWRFLEMPNRTEKEDELMRETAHASIFHWLKREDFTDQNRSIGFWQVSRVYAVLKREVEARFYAERCLKVSGGLAPFYIGYGHEALARAARLAGNDAEFSSQLSKARAACDQVPEGSERDFLSADLEELSR